MTSSTLQLPDLIQDASKLPSLPAVALEILRLTKDPNADIDQLTRAISLDPAMSVRLLKLANSPQYRRDREVTNLNHATVVLGFKTIKLLALSFSLADSLPRSGKNDRFDFAEYWRHSLTTAVAAQAMARLVKVPCGDEAFLAGLLLRIGQLVMATTVGKKYTDVVERSESPLPTADDERDVLGFDYHHVGQSLLALWGLPHVLVESVAQCNAPASSSFELDDDVKVMCQLLKIGDAVSALVGETADKGRTLKSLYAMAKEFFGLAEEEIDDMVVSLQNRVHETAAVLDVELSDDIDFGMIVDEARAQMLVVSLDTVADLSAAEERVEAFDIASRTDKLTGLPNRAYFDSRLQEVIAARLNGKNSCALGILIVDVDKFKSFNDQFGHAVGDEVLAATAKWLSDTTRGTDFTARYGGEEFVVIVPNTKLSDLEMVAERLRSAVEAGVVTHKSETYSLTVSVGGACVCDVESSDDGIALFELADECLYEAKEAGRNQCVCREVKLSHA
ncbi:HDOD domain-containing protein [Planctomycetota bacterium]